MDQKTETPPGQAGQTVKQDSVEQRLAQAIEWFESHQEEILAKGNRATLDRYLRLLRSIGQSPSEVEQIACKIIETLTTKETSGKHPIDEDFDLKRLREERVGLEKLQKLLREEISAIDAGAEIRQMRADALKEHGGTAELAEAAALLTDIERAKEYSDLQKILLHEIEPRVQRLAGFIQYVNAVSALWTPVKEDLGKPIPEALDGFSFHTEIGDEVTLSDETFSDDQPDSSNDVPTEEAAAAGGETTPVEEEQPPTEPSTNLDSQLEKIAAQQGLTPMAVVFLSVLTKISSSHRISQEQIFEAIEKSRLRERLDLVLDNDHLHGTHIDQRNTFSKHTQWIGKSPTGHNILRLRKGLQMGWKPDDILNVNEVRAIRTFLKTK